jgi:hypothetical protein
MLVGYSTSPGHAADLMPATAKVLDDNILIWIRPEPLISPDGKWVAYVSRGFVCVSNLDEAQPRRLYEVPGSITHLMAQPEHTPPDGDFNKVSSQLHKLATANMECLRWTHDSTAVAVSIVSHIEAEKKSVTRVVYIPIDGEPTNLAEVERSYESNDYFSPSFHLSRDRAHVVFDRHKRPLIWDTKSNKPRATGFLKLEPSSTSDRWIGVEKDTRQLVITDGNFEIVRRIEEYMPSRTFGLQLIWSPDERYVIWKNKVGFDHYSNWEGCRLDLETNERRILTGSYMAEIVEFTGRGGEFIRCGTEGVQLGWTGLANRYSYLMIVPHGDGHTQRLYSISADPNNRESRRYLLASANPLHSAPDSQLFLLATGRPEGPYGCIWHLVNRNRDRWRLSNGDNDLFESPFFVAGFAKGGETIVGYDKTRLFAFPTSSVYQNTKAVR